MATIALHTFYCCFANSLVNKIGKLPRYPSSSKGMMVAWVHVVASGVKSVEAALLSGCYAQPRHQRVD
jgi:hypothetical protein